MRSTGLCEQDKNNRQQAEFRSEAGGGIRTMEGTKMALNLKTLLLTMTMFKWGKTPQGSGFVCWEAQKGSKNATKPHSSCMPECLYLSSS